MQTISAQDLIVTMSIALTRASCFTLQARYTIIEKISRIPISTLADVNQVSTMIAAATEAKEYVNSTSQVNAYSSVYRCGMEVALQLTIKKPSNQNLEIGRKNKL